MKYMQKLACLMLALLMVLSLSITAFAGQVETKVTNDGALTVINAIPGEDYTLYKIFDLTYTGEEQAAPENGGVTPDVGGTQKVSYTITKTTDNAEFITKLLAADSPFTVTATSTENVYSVETKSQTLAEITNFLKENVDYFEQIGTKRPTVTDANNPQPVEITWDNLNYGYYYVASSVGASVSIDSTMKHVYVKDKNNLPTHDKKQIVAENQPTDQSVYQDAVTGIKVGDTVWYSVDITIGDVLDKEISITDTMSSGLKYKADSGIKVSLKALSSIGATATTVDATNYELTGPTTDGTDKTTFTLKLKADYVKTLKKGDRIWVNYGAIVTKDAVDTTQKNTCTLKYSNQHIEEVTDATSYKFRLDKLDGGNNPLYGAVFELFDGETVAAARDPVWFKQGTSESGIPVIYIVPEGTDDAFQEIRLTKDSEDTPAAPNVSLNSTKVIIKGLDGGKYILHEKSNPEGYKLAVDTAITSDLTLKADEPFPSTLADVDAKETQKGIIPVVNASGTELPSTGGIGTTIFYVVGSIMLVGAGVLLITKKRMSAEA